MAASNSTEPSEIPNQTFCATSHTARSRARPSMARLMAGLISSGALAKAVVLRRDGGYMLAVLPASHHLHLSALKSQLGHKVDLASEDEIERLFEDCERGAIPPLGECYGLDVIVDNSIDARRHVYMESGDHATLIRMEGAQFARLTAKAWRGHFSTHD